MNWELIADWTGTILLVLGTLFTLIAAISVVRYPDLLSRQHTATKPQVFSLMLLFAGVALIVRNNSITWTFLIVIAFQLLSSPISAHLMARSAYRTGRLWIDSYVVDELGEDTRTGDDHALS
ncbi:MAG: monovalent cation/H(+) antiporter subunit G [Actinomycetaceae bacterium]|nr:monovalent cation/H(+) antiporter subunit G [Actinomycetaceae bacterium]